MMKKYKLNWAFLLQWILGNTVGWIVGMALAIYIGAFVELFTQGVGTVLAWAVVATIAGLTMGINQWFILRLFEIPLKDKFLRWWVILTTLAWIPSLVIVIPLGAGEQLNYASSGAIIGITMGIAQWFVLRTRVQRAEWWAIANPIGWMAGLALADVMNEVLGFSLAGLVSGAITGLFLLWLLSHPLEETATPIQ